jgi:hypothetical protein
MKITAVTFIVFLSIVGCTNTPAPVEEKSPFGTEADQKKIQKALDSMESVSKKGNDTGAVNITTKNGSVITIKKADTSYYHSVK